LVEKKQDKKIMTDVRTQEEDCSTRQEQCDKRRISNFEARAVIRTIRRDKRRRTGRTIACKIKTT
jgi:hypothetical protein